MLGYHFARAVSLPILCFAPPVIFLVWECAQLRDRARDQNLMPKFGGRGLSRWVIYNTLWEVSKFPATQQWVIR